MTKGRGYFELQEEIHTQKILINEKLSWDFLMKGQKFSFISTRLTSLFMRSCIAGIDKEYLKRPAQVSINSLRILRRIMTIAQYILNIYFVLGTVLQRFMFIVSFNLHNLVSWRYHYCADVMDEETGSYNY